MVNISFLPVEVCSLSHYLQRFLAPSQPWFFGISYFNQKISRNLAGHQRLGGGAPGGGGMVTFSAAVPGKEPGFWGEEDP